jgi:hypothetical protein
MKHFARAMLAFGIIAAAVSPARANAPTTCNTTMTGGMINGDVVVPTNALCILDNLTVTGNVTVGTSATFIVNGGKIGGNILADGCQEVKLDGSQTKINVGGNVQIQGCTPVTHHPSGEILGSPGNLINVGGNFQCYDNNNAFCFAQYAKVGNNVQIYGNLGLEGSAVTNSKVGNNIEFNDNTCTLGTCQHIIDGNNFVGGNVQVNGNSPSEDISTNIIGGNLSCTGNTPSTGITGSGNTANGTELGQCVGF